MRVYVFSLSFRSRGPTVAAAAALVDLPRNKGESFPLAGIHADKGRERGEGKVIAVALSTIAPRSPRRQDVPQTRRAYELLVDQRRG